MVSVPADHIERVSGVSRRVDHALLANVDGEIAFAVHSRHVLRHAEVPLAERAVLEQLPEVVAVALRRDHGVGAFDDQPALLGPRGRRPTVDDPPRNHEVISGPVGQRAEHRFEHTLTVVDEDDLVAVGILVEAVGGIGLGRPGHGNRAVHIEHHRHSGGQRMARGRRGEARNAAGFEVFLDPFHRSGIHRLRDGLHHRRRIQVVQQGAHAHEADRTEELLVVERAIRLGKLRVALVRNLPALLIEGHGGKLARNGLSLRPPNGRTRGAIHPRVGGTGGAPCSRPAGPGRVLCRCGPRGP